TNRTDLFSYLETELQEVQAEMKAPRANEYARADQAAAWMLLAKLYLNAQVYIGQDRYTEALVETQKVIDAGFTLETTYQGLFLADNHTSPEIIFPIAFDGQRTKTWGGMTFLVHAPVGGSMNPAEFGINGGWGGMRATSALVNKFDDITGATDSRAMFYTDGQNLEIEDIFTFTDGYAVTKYKNVDSEGNAGSDSEGNFPDTDFPMFRLADAYLMYAEAVLRGASGGSEAAAIGYINELRERAYGDDTGNVSSIDLPFIIDERARELQWECHRRTDLIRFGLFTGGEYLWPWKGGVPEGTSVPDFRDLFPIPSADLIANPNLEQNPGDY
ncbi:MAG: RagB/SusD family nutrient uptake outer membrane protein, partial [Bacteroidota bacterium]